MAGGAGSEEWPEVQYINGHAVFKQYLTRVVTGLGVLIFTWSTVVLLGGFVSLLDNRDFWLLTLITLCQTQEASGAITGGVVEGFSGVTRLLGTEYTTANKPPAEPAPAAAGAAAPAKHATKAPMKLDQLARRVRARAMFVARATLILFRFLVFTTIVVPLVIVYTLGMYISTAISLYRLTQPDLGVGSAAAGDGTAGANLQKPALRVLYVMALVQGVLYFYGLTFTSTGRKMERKVADSYELASGKDSAVRSYAEATMDGCTKDLSFAKGRNMVTYAMGLVESASTDTDDFASGVTILNALIRLQERDDGEKKDVDERMQRQLRAQQALMRQLLIGSASSAHILGKLFEAASRSPAEEGGGGLRELAAAIVEHFAVDIRLSKVPGGIECVSSMLELSTITPELDQRKHTLHQSLRILRMLAGHNDNCRVISNAEGLLSGVMAPVNSDLLHRVGHEAWRPVVEESMELAARFVAAPGVAGVRLRRGISSNEEAVAAMGSILECDECQPPLQHVAIKILTQLAMDASSSTSAGSRERLARSMMRVFFDDGKASSSVVRKRRAAQALAMLSAQSQSIAAIILHANGNAIAALKHTILHSEDNEIRVSAVEILTHLRDHYTNDDEHLAELKKAIKDLMPEVLRLILGCEAPRRETKTGAEAADKATFLPPGAVGIDVQDDSVPGTCSLAFPRDSKLLEAFLSFTAPAFEASQAQDLAQLLEAVFPADAAFTIFGKLTEMVVLCLVAGSQTAHWLRIMKLTTMMIISILRLRGSGGGDAQEEAELHKLIICLPELPRSMPDADGAESLDDSGHGARRPRFKALQTLVDEAEEIADAQREGVIYISGSVDVRAISPGSTLAPEEQDLAINPDRC